MHEAIINGFLYHSMRIKNVHYSIFNILISPIMYIWKKNLNVNKGIFKILFLRVLECTQNRQIGFLPGLLVVSLHFYYDLHLYNKKETLWQNYDPRYSLWLNIGKNPCTLWEKSSSGILRKKSASFGIVILHLDVKEQTRRPTLVPMIMGLS